LKPEVLCSKIIWTDNAQGTLSVTGPTRLLLIQLRDFEVKVLTTKFDDFMLTAPDVYGLNKNVTKSDAYLALTSRTGAFSIISTRDRKEYGAKVVCPRIW
jgi:hypothetical protein